LTGDLEGDDYEEITPEQMEYIKELYLNGELAGEIDWAEFGISDPE